MVITFQYQKNQAEKALGALVHSVFVTVAECI